MLCFIDCYINDPTYESINEFIINTPYPWTYHAPSQYGMNTLECPELKPEVIILLGSAANVYENRPWQKPLERFLRQKLSEGIPVLGICYGHQLMAYSYGCEVGYIEDNEQTLKELRKIKFNSSLAPNFQSVQYAYSHAQIVKKISSQFKVLASSEKFKYECIQHKTLPYIGIQAHPEASLRFLKNECGVNEDLAKNVQAQGHQFINHFIKNAQSIIEKSKF